MPSVSFGRRPRNVEDLLAAGERARHRAAAGDDPGGVVGEDVAQREAALLRERVEDPADESLVLSARPRLASQRSISPSTCLRCASPKS